VSPTFEIPLAALAELQPGSAAVLRAEPAALRALIRDPPAETGHPACLWLPVPAPAPAGVITERAVAALAAVALSAWPRWYGRRLPAPANASPGALAALEAELARACPADGARDTRPEWLRRAARLAHQSRRPTPAGFSGNEQLRHLARAVAPRGLVLLLAPRWQRFAPPTTDALTRQAETLAHHAGVAIALVLAPQALRPAGLDRLPELVLHAGGEPAGEDDGPCFAPIAGRPHPFSRAESALADALERSPDLRGLFGWNRLVELSAGQTPRVDMLWTAGRLVVEIDSWVDHAEPGKFANDRERDYELLAAGYRVLRLTTDEVLSDRERALAKIRRIVAVCSAAVPEGNGREHA